MDKYGGSAEEAFKAVRAEIVKVAEAAAKGNLAEVDAADLGEAVRWKIAFLYQDRSSPTVLPFFKGEYLNLLLEEPESNLSNAHVKLMKGLGRKRLLDYADVLWDKLKPILDEMVTPQKARAFLESSAQYHSMHSASDKVFGYQSGNGNPMVLASKGKRTVLYMSPFHRERRLTRDGMNVERCEADQIKNREIFAYSSMFDLNKPFLEFTPNTMSELVKACEMYADSRLLEQHQINQSDKRMANTGPKQQAALNTILYGPPGTGKTYATTELAVKIAEPEEYERIDRTKSGTDRRQAIKNIYEQLVSDKRVAFTTFHQSFSYEDFIEGIRAKPTSDNGGLLYEVEDGIFKSMAYRTDKTVSTEQGLGLSAAPTIWKISIGRRSETELRQRYIDAGEARIGWNSTGDLKLDLDDRSDEERSYWNSLSYKNHATINNFAEDMQVGDVLLCLKDATKVQAIGIVASDYFFDNTVDALNGAAYAHGRKVNWLLTDIEFDILPINDQTRMVQQTVYPLTRISWDDLVNELGRQGFSLTSTHSPLAESKTKPNYVLIIDEINRGNISRIFGELITLLEPDKRKGGADEKSVILPYSKEPFSVPANLYVIGTMNTADKSLVQLDLALRRRFEFTEVMPESQLLDDVEVHGVSIGQLLEVINGRIEVLLDRDYLIGHSYFLPLKQPGIHLEATLASIFRNKLIPMLQEYFFSDWEKIGWVLNDIDKAWEHRFIQLQQEKTQLNSLFSTKIAEDLQDRRYRINPDAFLKPESYQGIMIKAV
ncbi:MAG: restriction endonuclease [Ketobacter sp.]|nr:MAG: restriction endonuclease [Ketobacter sp.]